MRSFEVPHQVRLINSLSKQTYILFLFCKLWHVHVGLQSKRKYRSGRSRKKFTCTRLVDVWRVRLGKPHRQISIDNKNL